MQLSVFVGGEDVSHLALLDETSIRRDATDAISTASVVFFVDFDAAPKWDQVNWDQFTWAFEPREWQVLELKDQAGTRQFAGYVTKIERQVEADQKRIACTAADFGVLLDRVILNDTFINLSDAEVIQAAFSSAGITFPSVNPANLTTLVGNLGTFEAKDITLRELLERVCDLTGGEWRVDYSGALRYFGPGVTAAPFSVSDSPNNTTSFGHYITRFSRDFSRAANRITFLGGFDASGAEITTVAQSLESQAKYGILSATVVDRSVTDQATADLRARAEIQQRAFPLENGTLTVYRDGLDVGQTLSITNTEYSLSGSYLIRSVQIKQVNKSNTGADDPEGLYCVYEIEFGQRTPDLVSALRRLEQKAKQPTYTPVAKPAPQSVTTDNFATTLTAIHIVTAKPTDWSGYEPDAVFLLTTDRKLYRRVGNDWTAAVPAVDLTGQITETQIGPDSVGTPALKARAITSDKAAIGFLLAEHFTADCVTAGTIATGAIRASDAVFEAAAIKKADIDLVSALRLIVGTANIDDLSVTNVKVASGLSASKMTTGTLDAQLVNVINLNASNVTTGTLAADRIGGGTITASVTMTSPNLTITSGGTTVKINATDFIQVESSGTLIRTQLTANGLEVYSTAFSTHVFVGPLGWEMANSVGGGVKMSLTNYSQAGGTVPTTSLGYLTFYVDGIARKVPYFA